MRHHRTLLGLGLITLLGAVVRIVVAATEPPHFDESYTAVHYVQSTLGNLLTTYDEPNNHLFHSLLAHLSTAVFGAGPFALRLPALLAGIALVPLVGLLGRAAALAASGAAADGAGEPEGRAWIAGLVAATIVAAAPPLIAYSANARGYSMALVLFAAQLWLSLHLARPSATPAQQRALAWVAWIACGALAVWTVPTAVMGVLFATIWLTLMRASQRSWAFAAAPVLAAASAGAVAIALYAPVLGQRGFTVERFTAPPVRQLATTLAHAWTAGLSAPLIAVAIVLAVVGFARRPRLGPALTPAAGLLAIPLTIAVLGRVPPYSRTYLFLLPVLAVLAGVGAARIAAWLRHASDDRAPATTKGGGTALIWAAVGAFAVFAASSALSAQTRSTWGEDPPGPPHAATVAVLRSAAANAQAPAPGQPPSALALLSPAFTVPQVEYAASRLAPPAPAVRSTAVASEPGPWLLITRADVEPADAVHAVGLDRTPGVAAPVPNSGDLLVLELRRR